MKTIGLLGGMSWESTVSYYRIINRAVGERLGGLHSARILLYSFDFDDVERLQVAGRWSRAGELLAEAARTLEDAGADFIVLCTNTMHRVAGAIEAAIGVPLLHIADPTGRAARDAGHSVVGLLGTRFTMEEGFLSARLESEWDVRVLVPDAASRERVHDVIYSELCRGIVSRESRSAVCRVVGELAAKGAQGVVLGCTEIGLLVGADDVPLPVLDTTRLHAEAAARLALEETA